ncbi:DUF4845 domain-containing protein [archaeon]|nr:DUF4845 domain-containing protein [archaeon]
MAIAIIGFVGIFGFQIGLGYLNKQVIQKAVKNVLIDNRQNKEIGVKSIRDEILTKISLDSIDLSTKDVFVSKDSYGFNVQINYIKRIQINPEISIVMDFNIDEVTP